MDNYTKRILATNASSLARLLGLPVVIQAGDVTMKAIPGDVPDDVYAKAGGDSPSVPDAPMASDWKLSSPPGDVLQSGFRASPPQWLGKPDPGYKGESRKIQDMEWEKS